MALSKLRPVLVLSESIDYTNKVQDPYFYASRYKNKDDLRRSIKRYLRTVKSKHLRMRLGVFLHNRHVNFLDWYVNEYDIDANRSKIIRDSLDEYMKSTKYNTIKK